MDPTVSIIIPNYNHALYLEERINSILNQSYQNFEIIILDDKSTDNSLEIINKYKSHPKIAKIICNDKNSGSTFKQWNLGIKHSSGQYIWIAESDDTCRPIFLETLLQKIISNEKIVVAYCQSTRMNSLGEITGSWQDHTQQWAEKFSSEFCLHGEDFIEKYLIQKNVIPNASGVIFRKQRFLDVGGVDEDIKYCSDWLLWIKILLSGDIYYTSTELNNFRYYNKSVIASSQQKEIVPFRKKFDIIMRERLSKYLLKCKSSQLIHLNYQHLSIENETEFRYLFPNHKKNAFQYLFKYFKYSKINPKKYLKLIKFATQNIYNQ